MTDPVWWFANRGTGLVLLGLLTVTVVLGVLATAAPARPDRGLPAFVGQAVHRSAGVLALVLLAVHVVTAVVDDYVDIGWRDVVVPFIGGYRPLPLGLGTVAFDLLVAVAVTSAVRHRMPDQAWRVVHLSTYLAWALALWHTVGIGTDTGTPWGRWVVVGCLGAALAAAGCRVAAVLRRLSDRATGRATGRSPVEHGPWVGRTR